MNDEYGDDFEASEDDFEEGGGVLGNLDVRSNLDVRRRLEDRLEERRLRFDFCECGEDFTEE